MSIAAPYLNEAGFKVMGLIDSQAKSNVAVSPTSLSQAMLMALMGAEGTTREELRQFLALPSMAPDKLEDWISAASPRTGRAAGTVTVDLSNSAWLKQGFSVRSAYTAAIRKAFDADVRSFTDGEEIGDWIAEKSRGSLGSKVPPLGNASLCLVNVIYFKGRWDTVFDKAETKPRPFHPDPGRTIQVPMMHLSEKFHYGASEGAQIAVLPYEKSSYEMVVILPGEGARPGLSRDRFEHLVDLAEKTSSRRGDLLMPRFTVDRLYNLTRIIHEGRG